MDEPMPSPVVARRQRRLSLVWLVPLVALVVGGVLVLRALLQSGPDITIEFRTAEGLEPGRTEVRYKEVVVGRVTDVALTRDGKKVLVSVSLQKSAEHIAVKDTRFWVVRPRVGAAGVSGLGTLLSGAYIGADAGVSGERQRQFAGLEAAPFVLRGEPGRSFVLNADDLGSLDVGSPVYYRRTRVGRVVGYTLDPQRDALSVQVFIESPYDTLVTTRTRFWNASGIDLSVNARGLTVNTQSLASMFAGGVAFARADGAASAPVATEGQRFFLFANQQLALAPPDGVPLRVRMLFEQSSRGLEIGAPVDLLGVEIGNVRSITLQHEPGSARYPVEVIAEIFPARLGAVRHQFAERNGRDVANVDARFVKRLVENGMRAQMRTANLLTGQMYIGLEFIARAKPAAFDEQAELPTLPSVPGALSEVQPQIAEIIDKISRVNFDRIGSGLEETLQSANAASKSLDKTLNEATLALRQLTPEAQHALADVRRALESAQRTLANADRNLTHADAPIQRSANATLQELARAAQALRVLADYLQQHPESLLRGKPADRSVAPAEVPTR